MEETENKVNYLFYVIALIVLLIIATIAITFAYYNVDTGYSNTLVDISASLDCIDLELSSSGSNLSLSYNYPITDELAQTSGSITPVTVSVTNNCSTSKNYTLALSTLSLTNSTSSYIDDNQIRLKVIKNNETYKNAMYLNQLSEVSSTNQAYKDLTGTSGELTTKYPDYTVKKIYAIDDIETIEPNNKNTYSIYMWVDYYEGDSVMYTSNAATHDESYDNSTAGKKFAAAISLSLNPSDNNSGSTSEGIELSTYLINNALEEELWDSTFENDGYRYIGTNPDNYICFGTTDKDTCTSDTDKYMYRIIGIFTGVDGKQYTKLIKNSSIGNYNWGSGSARWSSSDLYKRINGQYFFTNGDYPYMQNSNWINKIIPWSYIDVSTESQQSYYFKNSYGLNYVYNTIQTIYYHESNQLNLLNDGDCVFDMAEIALCSNGAWGVSADIGLMYVSDYALSMGGDDTESMLYDYSMFLNSSWLYTGLDEWFMTNDGNVDGEIQAYYIDDENGVGLIPADSELAVRPVFYLESDVKYVDGIGSEDDPYMLG